MREIDNLEEWSVQIFSRCAFSLEEIYSEINLVHFTYPFPFPREKRGKWGLSSFYQIWFLNKQQFLLCFQ